jgi:hypothetical protein
MRNGVSYMRAKLASTASPYGEYRLLSTISQGISILRGMELKLLKIILDGLICLPLLAAGCGDKSNCEPEFKERCVDGIVYWVDSCGKMGDLVRECQHGCNPNGIECLEISCTSSTECPDGTYCDIQEQTCKLGECVPGCDEICCGNDGCGGSCPEECPVDMQCNPQTCICENLERCSSNTECKPDEVCLDGICDEAWGATYRITVEQVLLLDGCSNWDTDGTCPDLLACFFKDVSQFPGNTTAAEFCTSVELDTDMGRWKEEYFETILLPTDDWTFFILDEDADGWDIIREIKLKPIPLDNIHFGSLVGPGSDIVILIEPVG